MSVLLLGAHMSIAGGVSYALDRAASVHSNAVQVFTKNNRQWVGPPINEADIERWRVQKPALGIVYAVSHASYLINLASPKDDLWEKSRLAHQDELVRAHAYGIPHVVLHPGSHTGAGEQAGIRRIAEALNRIHEETPDCTDTLTCLEIMAGQGSVLGRKLDELRAVIDLVEDRSRVGVCLDTCHAFAAGYDIRTPEGYAAFMREVDRWLGVETVKVWHFNDSKGTLGSNVDRHVHIGEGEIGEEGFRHILNDPRWDGIAMLLETPKDDTLAEDAMNLARLCALVEDVERIPPGLRSTLSEGSNEKRGS
ncbi:MULTISPECIES: deoxyribonuclease IV [Caldilinea]|jgi:deoxyribonuclease-4|uniref:Probable endonuclease 4 n=1 Tax=Caldilinea aerophila (strain DSM 14535 / JCM 11387 / NBRC 104270 / STL-6-O1) TaxID=926550 RepID=I0I544_CALAS|nr:MULTISPECIES: deoxyribonuclease IV [Caldilinea]MBO9391969.1 deoxyribonuclease IV [Caldilinea sp.]BAM00382.1 endonuclease 4 [Caldilinea aerophila DSM 14535 = NBRC 104270]